MKKKLTVFLTGAAGGMGMQSLQRMVKDYSLYDTIILVRDSEKNRLLLRSFEKRPGLEIVWGDLNDYEKVSYCVRRSDMALHVAAFVSPAASACPRRWRPATGARS